MATDIVENITASQAQGHDLVTVVAVFVPTEPDEPWPPFEAGGYPVTISVSGALDVSHLQGLADADVVTASGTHIALATPFVSLDVSGAGFRFDPFGDLIGGTVTSFTYVDHEAGGLHLTVSDTAGISVLTLENMISAGFTVDSLSSLIPGAESLSGSIGGDTIHEPK